MLRQRLPGKNRVGHIVGLTVFVALLAGQARGEIIAQYAFGGGSTASTDTDLNSNALAFTAHSTTNEGVTTDIDTGISSSSHMAYLRSDATGATQADALDDDDYFSFTVNAANGNVLNLKSLVFDLGGSAAVGSGFTNTAYVQSSVDGFGSANPIVDQASSTIEGIGGGAELTNPGVSIGLTDAKFQGLSSITFRFSFMDDINNSGSIDRLDNVVLNAAVPVPEPTTWAMCLLAAAALALRSVRRCPENETHQ